MDWKNNNEELLSKWKDEIIERYNLEASDYDKKRYIKLVGRLEKDLQNLRLMNLIRPHKHHQILEIGCGTGRFTKYFSDHGISIVAIDPSEKMREIAKSKVTGNCLIIEGELEKVPFKPNSFDYVFCMKVFRHLPDKVIIKGIKEMLRVTKESGSVFIDLPHWGLMTNLGYHLGIVKSIRSRIFSLPEIQRLFKDFNYTTHYGFPRYLPEFKSNFFSYVHYLCDLFPMKKQFYSQVVLEFKKVNNKSEFND